VEIHDRLIALLTDVDELRSKEAALIRRRSCAHLEQMAQSEGEVVRCNGELDDVRENQLRLRREMDGLRDVLFTREEDEALSRKQLLARRRCTGGGLHEFIIAKERSRRRRRG
jgi:hypothetical protein